MKDDLRKFALYLFLKYAIGFLFVFQGKFTGEFPNTEGFVFATFVLLIFPAIDILIFFPIIHLLLDRIRNDKKTIGIIGLGIVIIAEVYITRKLSQDRYMEWHVWKGMISAVILLLVYRETFKSLLKRKQASA